jgi:hypothetical protein
VEKTAGGEMSVLKFLVCFSNFFLADELLDEVIGLPISLF